MFQRLKEMFKKRNLGLFPTTVSSIAPESWDRSQGHLNNLPATRPMKLKKHECVSSFKNLLQREVEFSHSMAILLVINKFSLIIKDFA